MWLHVNKTLNFNNFNTIYNFKNKIKIQLILKNNI